jgi:biopolymer transport protein ExbD
MSLKKTSHSHHSSLNELNITPLLDLVFVLLVIFIITTPQMMNNLEMNLPSGQTPPQTQKPKFSNIVVSTKGTFLNDEMVTIAALKEKLKQLKADQFKADGTDLSVVVKGADNVDYQNMINVLDVLQQLDITKVGLATAAAGAVSP